MRTVTIIRTETDDLGTFGLLTTDSGFQCYTAELPWRDLNGDGIGDPLLSCINSGTYATLWAPSPTRKNKDGTPEFTYRLAGVKGRDGILIHTGNYAGDITKGYKSSVQGCITLGRAIMDIAGQKGVSSSRDAIHAFQEDVNGEPFMLAISWADGIQR